MPYKPILWFKEVNKDDLNLVGGKGLNLGLMAKGNFNIPAGFIITTKAYWEFLEATKLKKEIIQRASSINVDNTIELKEESKKIREMIKKVKMPEDIMIDILKAYVRLGEEKVGFYTSKQHPYVAVRSSASAEDLPSASFAGQQETFLNVHGKEELIKAVQACWASLFTARAIYYRRKDGFPEEKVGIAVVVQKMVDADVSGVMFTADPTGDESKIVIEAVFGLGEAIVSGSITPDTYVVDKKSLNILSRNVMPQQWMITRKRGKTEKIVVDSITAKKEKLSKEKIQELADIGRKIERFYEGKPQDIEFAIEKGQILIVQSRAVTTLKLKEKMEKAKILTEITEKPLIEGLAASPGIASSKASVIKAIEEIGKVNVGDILVTRMTSPDWVPVMKKVKAIITDEGGITCFSGNTKLLTNHGLKTFKETLELIKNGEAIYALSINPQTLKPEWKKITAAMQKKAQTIKVGISQTGKSQNNYIEVTPEHKFMHLNKRRIMEKEISKIIKDNEYVNTVDFIPAVNSIKEMKLLERTHTSTIKEHTFMNSASALVCHSNNVVVELEHEYDKLNYWVLHTNEDNIKAFLGSIIDDAGSINKSNGYKINIHSSDKQLIEAITLALLRLGIQPTIQKNKANLKIQITEGLDKILKYSERKEKPRKKIQGTKLFSARQLLSDIKESKLKDKIKPHIEKNLLIDSEKIKEIIVQALCRKKSDELTKIINSPLRMKRVNFIENQGIQDVYNIEVEDYHNYVVFTSMLTPLWVANCHAAIVSRELGIPCIVGTVNGTKKIPNRALITANGFNGKVYEGEISIEVKEKLKKFMPITEKEFDEFEEAVEEGLKEERTPELRMPFEENEAIELKERIEEERHKIVEEEKEKAIELIKEFKGKKTEELDESEKKKELELIMRMLEAIRVKVKVNVALPEAAERAAKTGADGIGLLRAEHMITAEGKHPVEYIVMGQGQELIRAVKEGIKKVAIHFKDKPIWYRTFDARTDEFRHLKGGEREPIEDNPMLGWHGIRRDLDEQKIFKAQLIAVKQLRDEGFTNIGVMLPFVTHAEQVSEAKKLMKEVGLNPEDKNFEFGVMIETPAAVWIIDELIAEGIKFISFGTNDLTQLTLGIDRNNERIQKWFSELHPAVLRALHYVIKKCKAANVKTSICGQAGSNPEMVRHLVHYGIDSVSANIDAVEKIRQVVLEEEKNLILGKVEKL